jgi:hypothetical protein
MKTRVLLLLSVITFLSFIMFACKPDPIDPVSLEVPVISIVSENEISWTTINQAVAYDLDIDGITIRVTQNHHIFENYGTYLVKVRAVADRDSNFLDSPWSAIFTVEYEEPVVIPELPKVDAPIIDKFDHQSIVWLQLPNVSGYEVYLNGEAQTEILDESVLLFSIEHLPYGVYEIQLKAISGDKENFADSDLSNKITLERIDPLTFKDRLMIDITGHEIIIMGDQKTYIHMLKDTLQSDITYLNQAVNWNITEGAEKAEITPDGHLTAISEGTVTIEASLIDYPEVTGTFVVSIVNRPTIEVEIEQYDKLSNENMANLTSSVGGVLYYLNLSLPPASIESFISNQSVKQTTVTAQTNQINLVLGRPSGTEMTVYFVLKYMIDDKVIGFSEIFVLSDIPMEIVETEVSTALDLRNALMLNEDYIKLMNDIVLDNVWAQVSTVFTGVLDGNGFSIRNLHVEGSRTGMFRTLGHGAVIKNISFIDAEARNFSGPENAIISNTVAFGATVRFENVALINAKSISSVEGSSRSTHAALIAHYNNKDDQQISIQLEQVYIEYTHHVTRTTSAANTGGVFGTFVSSSVNGLMMNNVYLDVRIIGSFDNAGAVVGQGSGHYTFNHVVTHFEFVRGVAGNSTNGAEIGSIRSTDGIISTFSGSNNIFMSPTSNQKGTWNNSEHAKVYSELSANIILEVKHGTFWNTDLNNVLMINVNNQVFMVKNLVMLETPVPYLNEVDLLVEWPSVENATGYIVSVNGVDVGSAIEELSFSYASFLAGTYLIRVRAVGEGMVNSDFSQPVTVVVSPKQLDQPILSVQETLVTWETVLNASSYQVFVNGVSHGALTSSTSFNLEFFDPGLYQIQVVAKGDQVNFTDSEKSEAIEVEVHAPELPRLSTPELTVNGTLLSWNFVENAVSYQLFVNGIAHGTPILNESFDFDTFELGQYIVVVQAIADPLTHLDSIPSEVAVVIVAEMVTTAAELKRLHFKPIKHMSCFQMILLSMLFGLKFQLSSQVCLTVMDSQLVIYMLKVQEQVCLEHLEMVQSLKTLVSSMQKLETLVVLKMESFQVL